MNTATSESAQAIYATKTKAIIKRWQLVPIQCPRGRPKFWTQEIKSLPDKRFKAYRKAQKVRDVAAVCEHELLTRELKMATQKKERAKQKVEHSTIRQARFGRTAHTIQSDQMGQKQMEGGKVGWANSSFPPISQGSSNRCTFNTYTRQYCQRHFKYDQKLMVESKRRCDQQKPTMRLAGTEFI